MTVDGKRIPSQGILWLVTVAVKEATSADLIYACEAAHENEPRPASLVVTVEDDPG